jgi:hypothetical protein
MRPIDETDASSPCENACVEPFAGDWRLMRRGHTPVVKRRAMRGECDAYDTAAITITRVRRAQKPAPNMDFFGLVMRGNPRRMGVSQLHESKISP